MSTTELARSFLGGDQAAASSPIPSELAQLIVQHQGTLLDVVRASSESLTSEDDAFRGRGLGLLAHVVLKCPKDAVTRQEGKTLSEFFTTSLSSSSSDAVLIPTMEGLTALAKLPSFGAGEAIAASKSVFANVEMMGRPQSTRYLVYCFFDVLMAFHRRALKRMGQEFLTGYCKLVTGEKDPRNLRLAFGVAKVILVEFDITNNVEDLFDITFCYFPITFTPPPNDPYGITSDDLQAALRECLSATPRFGPLALPLFMEKLQASTNTAKRQTLQALIVSFPVYGRAVVKTQAAIFWEAFSVEVFHANDEEIEGLALDALEVMLRVLYPDEGDQDMPSDDSRSVAWKMCDACLLELNDADKSNATPATKILSRALAASGVLARYVTSRVFPHILKIYKLPDEVMQRPALFTVMAKLFAGLKRCPVPRPAEALAPYREEILSISISNLRVQETRVQALDCLVQLIQLPDCLAVDELAFALQNITDLFLIETRKADSGEMTPLALKGLVSVALVFTQQVQEVVLPPLFNLLPEAAPAKQDIQGQDAYRLSLAALSELAVLPQLFDTFLIRILSRLDFLCAASSADTGMNRHQYSQNALYAHHILKTLKLVLERKIKGSHIDFVRHVQSTVSRLAGFLFVPILRHDQSSRSIAADPRIIEGAGQIVMILVRTMDEQQQIRLADDLRLAFFDGLVGSLVEGSSSSRLPSFYSAEATVEQRNLLPFHAYALYAMRKEVFEASDASTQLALILVQNLPACAKEFRYESSCRLLASLLNKVPALLQKGLSASLNDLWETHVLRDSSDLDHKKAALYAFAWAMRGLILRSDNYAYSGLANVLDLFDSPDLGKEAARTMSTFSKDNDGVLVKENFAAIKLLYKQRFFAFILPRLTAGYQRSQEGTSPSSGAAYLIGLSCLLQNMPKQTVIAEVPKLLPLLLRALDLQELDLRSHVIDTLAFLVKEAPGTIKDQAGQIVTILLKNASVDDPKSDSEDHVQLRLSTLRCLAVFPDTIDWLSLHQQKAPVLRVLGKAVDDHKKKVRKEAVDCRARWFLFKAP